jgi:hypothetical protein
MWHRQDSNIEQANERITAWISDVADVEREEGRFVLLFWGQ